MAIGLLEPVCEFLGIMTKNKQTISFICIIGSFHRTVYLSYDCARKALNLQGLVELSLFNLLPLLELALQINELLEYLALFLFPLRVMLLVNSIELYLDCMHLLLLLLLHMSQLGDYFLLSLLHKLSFFFLF